MLSFCKHFFFILLISIFFVLLFVSTNVYNVVVKEGDEIMGNRLRMLRNESHISLRTLSKYTHITNPVLSYLENGVRPFRQTHIDILCSFFNVTSDYLLGRTDNGLFVHTQIGEDELLLNESEYNNAMKSYLFFVRA